MTSLTRLRQLRYTRPMRAVSLLVLTCLLASPGAEAKRLHLRRPARGFQMRMESFVVAPGGDREGCEYLVTPNRKPMDVGAFELKSTPATHHFVVWEYLGNLLSALHERAFCEFLELTRGVSGERQRVIGA